VPCPKYSTISKDRYTCLKATCTGREILEDDGTCRNCLDYTRPDDERKNCFRVSCSGNDKLNIGGFCEPCPEGTVVSKDKKTCDLNVKSSRPTQAKASPDAGRMKSVGLVSISPLDRLLNQNDVDDSI